MSDTDNRKLVILPPSGSKGQIFVSFSDWQKKWGELNSGNNYDEGSSIISNNELVKINILENNKYELLANFPNGIPNQLKDIPFTNSII